MPNNRPDNSWERFIEPAFGLATSERSEEQTRAVYTAVTLLPEVFEGRLNPYTHKFVEDALGCLAEFELPFAHQCAVKVFAGDAAMSRNVVVACRLAYDAQDATVVQIAEGAVNG